MWKYLILAFLVAGCDSSQVGSSSAETTTQKPLASSWSNSSMTLDLARGSNAKSVTGNVGICTATSIRPDGAHQCDNLINIPQTVICSQTLQIGQPEVINISAPSHSFTTESPNNCGDSLNNGSGYCASLSQQCDAMLIQAGSFAYHRDGNSLIVDISGVDEQFQ
jgi:hypothetical protein